jgi:CBS domain-containing protein
VVVTVQASDSTATLSERLREKRIGAAVVSRDGQGVDGVISERDIAYALSSHKAGLHTLPVSALMTATVITCARAARYPTWQQRWQHAIFAMCQSLRSTDWLE